MTSVRHALCSLARTPGFTIVAVVTLALGLGLTTGMFSVMNALLLRPLPFPDSDQLVRVHRVGDKSNRGGISPADYLDLKRSETGFGQFAAYQNTSVSVAAPDQPPEMQSSLLVSADYFSVLHLEPELGRTFLAEEEIRGHDRVVVLSHAFWQERFGGSTGILGQSLRVDGEPHEIVGVLSATAEDSRVLRANKIFRAMSLTEDERANRTNRRLNVIGRRDAAVTEPQGAAFIDAFSARLAADFPVENRGSHWRSESLLSATTNQNARGVIAMLLGLAACVLLIACGNLANLLLARTVSRAHELAVRAALGASRARLLRLLVTESLLLLCAGGTGALLVASWSGQWLSAQSVASGGEPLDFPLDWRVLGFACTVSLITALCFGAMPALVTTRINVIQGLKSGARGSTTSRGHRRFRHSLVALQCAMAMVLLSGAGYFLRGARAMLHQHFGWDSDRVLVAEVQLPEGKHPRAEDIVTFHQRALERLENLPGVTAASVCYVLPLYGLAGPRDYVVGDAGESKTPAAYNGVTPSYFAATGTRLLRGRVFASTDTAGAPSVAIINETMARALFGDADPIGQRLARADGETRDWSEIVGVVADVRYVTMYQRAVPFQVYHPFVQDAWHHASLAIRVDGVAPESLIASVRRVVAEIDPDLPLRDLMPATAMIARGATEYGMLSKMLGGFALLGLGLATLGLAAVMARAVALRTNEIGIRMAVGAPVSAILRMIVATGVRLVLAGILLGGAGGWAVSRLIGAVMPGVETGPGYVLASAAGLLVTAALIASYAPARRATKIDPLTALRAE